MIILGHLLTDLGIKEVVDNGPGNDRLPVLLQEHVPRGVDGEETVDHLTLQNFSEWKRLLHWSQASRVTQ